MCYQTPSSQHQQNELKATDAKAMIFVQKHIIKARLIKEQHLANKENPNRIPTSSNLKP